MSRPPDDPADHAEEFAHTWVDRLENAVEGRMHALDIPEEQIGSGDHQHGIAWCTFSPFERDGGGNSPGGRINVDSGVLNPELMRRLGPEVSEVWARARLRDRIDSVIVHEFEEDKGGSHEYAVANAPMTAIPVNDRVRTLLKRIKEGEEEVRTR